MINNNLSQPLEKIDSSRRRPRPTERPSGGGFGNGGGATTTSSNDQIEARFEYAIDDAGNSKFESLWRKKEGNVDEGGRRIFQFHNASAASTTSATTTRRVFVGLNSIRTALESSAAQYRRRELLPSEPQMEQEAKRYSPPMPMNVTSSTWSVVNNIGMVSTTNNVKPPIDGSNDDGVNPAIRAASLSALEAGTIARAKLRASMEGASSSSTTVAANDTMTGVERGAEGERPMTSTSATDFFLTQDPNRPDHAFDYDDYAGPLPSDEDVAMLPSRHRTARVTSSPMAKGNNNRGGGFGNNNDVEFGEDEFETALDDDELAALDVDNIVSQKPAAANNVDTNYNGGDNSYDRVPLRTLYGGSFGGGGGGRGG